MNDLIKKLSKFASDRDWEQFHSPKNLSMALSIEVAELMEHFQWLTEDQSRNIDKKKLEKVRDEIGDIQIYLARLADQLGIDPLYAAKEKMKKNELKFPIGKAQCLANKIKNYNTK
jgi:dCTP diphosphatase